MIRTFLILMLLFCFTAPAFAQAVDAGPDAATVAPAPAAAPAPSVDPQISDVSLVTKLWKSGSFLAVGILAVYLGLFAWAKLDKKHAFYASASLAAVIVLVDAIRKGDTPTASTLASTLTTLAGVLIAGPNHVAA